MPDGQGTPRTIVESIIPLSEYDYNSPRAAEALAKARGRINWEKVTPVSDETPEDHPEESDLDLSGLTLDPGMMSPEVWLTWIGSRFGAQAQTGWAAYEAAHRRIAGPEYDAAEAQAAYTAEIEQEESLDRCRRLMDRQVACDFAEAFTGGDYRKLRLSVYGVKGQARDFECDGDRHAVDAHWDDLVAAQAAGNQVFFYLNEVTAGAGHGRRGVATNDDVDQLQTFSVDFDGGLPSAYHVEPDIVINTSKRVQPRASSLDAERQRLGADPNGIVPPDGSVVQRGQALWRTSDYLEGYQKPGMASRFKRMQQTLAAHYDPDGWAHRHDKDHPQITDKSVTDLRRVHRLPGSLHLKDPANPQLVTFERRYSGPRRWLAQIHMGVPEAPEEESPAAERVPIEDRPSAEASRQHAIAEIVLRETLSYIDPPADEPSWRKIVAAIKATPLLGDAEQVAVDWSAGRLDRKGRYVSTPPDNWGGDEIVREKYRLAKEDKPNGKVAGFGSLHHLAMQHGYPGVHAPGSPAAIFGDRIESDEGTKEVLPDEAQSSRGSKPFLLSIADLMAWPDPKPLVHDFLMQGEDACLYSPPKCGKTFVALDVSLSLAAGLPVLGHLGVLRPNEIVVYLSGEGHAGMKRRIAAWGASRELTEAQIGALPFYYKTDVPATAGGAAEAKRYVEGIRAAGLSPVLIVIDTMSRSLGQEDENTAGAANAYLNMVAVIRRAFGCTMLTLAHSGKGDGAAARGVRGSSAFTGGFDAIWYLEANKENRTAKLEAMWLKDADELGPHCFRVEPISVAGMGMGAALRYLPLTEYKDPENRSAEAASLRMRIRVLLAEEKIIGWKRGLTHAQVAELLLPPKPTTNVREWDTEYQVLRRELNNAKRGVEGKRMGGNHVVNAGGKLEWVWYLPEE